MAVNVFAAAYTLLTVIFTFFPPTLPVTAETMNYSCVVYGGVIMLGIIYYVVWGRKGYRGPTTELQYVR